MDNAEDPLSHSIPSSSESDTTPPENTLTPLLENREALANQTPFPLILPVSLHTAYQILACRQEGFFLQTPHGAYNSKVQSSKEAKQTVERFLPQWKEYPAIFVLGLELGYHTLEILRQSPLHSVWVFEPSLETITAACQIQDFSSYIRAKRLHIFLIPSHGNISSLMANIPVYRAHIFVHRATYEHYRHSLEQIRDDIVGILQMKAINLYTIDYFQRLWIPHALRNLRAYLESPDISCLVPHFKNQDVIIVAAGPSLEKNLSRLKDLRREKQCLLIAVNTILPRLFFEEIVPDIIVAVDPQNILYHNLTSCFWQKNAPLLVAHPSLSPMIVNHYPGSVLFCHTSLLQDIIPPHLLQKTPLDMGGSVVTAAYSLAIQLQAKTITLLGMDLSYESRAHIRGNFQDLDFLFRSSSRWNSWEQFSFTKGNPPAAKISHPGFFGVPVRIDAKFQTYIDWLENRFAYYQDAFPTRNCTEGGIAFRSIPNIPLSDVVPLFPALTSVLPPWVPPATFHDNTIVAIRENLEQKLHFFEESAHALAQMRDKKENISDKENNALIQQLLQIDWVAFRVKKAFAEMQHIQFQEQIQQLGPLTSKDISSHKLSLLLEAVQENIALLRKLSPLFSGSYYES